MTFRSFVALGWQPRELALMACAATAFAALWSAIP